MESKRIELEEWVKVFYLLKACAGSRKAMAYSDQLQVKVVLATMVSMFMLVLIPIFAGKFFGLNKNWISAGIYICIAIVFLSFHFGWKRVEKRWKELAPYGDELDLQIKRALYDISLLNPAEKEMLQNLVDARGDKWAFAQKLKKALEFGRLKDLGVLHEIEDFIRENEAAANQPKTKKEEGP